MVDYKANPFFLNDEDISWVENKLASMSLKEKVGQMFNVVFAGGSIADIDKLYTDIPFGGITFRPDRAASVKEKVDYIQRKASIPVLVSANLESGADGIVHEGSSYISQLGVAATGDSEYAYNLGDICGEEGAAVGGNYAFAPVVDILYNWRNPIVNTRAYGDSPESVIEYASKYIEGIQKHGFAVAIKHFPGDGVDERDQHLVSTVNSLSKEEWMETFGKVYRALIDKGAETVMVGHILLPSYCSYTEEKEVLPSSLSKEIVTSLLRKQLGFNGVVITDSASMTGLGCALPRKEIPAKAVDAGCDIFLFGRNVLEDFNNLYNSVVEGAISEERINDSVRRILALKAHLHLYEKKAFTSDNPETIVGSLKNQKRAIAVADRAITLVKDTQGLIPISPYKYKNILLLPLGDEPGARGGWKSRDYLKETLEREGFTVSIANKETLLYLATAPVEQLKNEYDLLLYIGNEPFGKNNTVNRIAWAPFLCGESPSLVQDIPTIFVSFSSPFHFVDVPMIRTIINCYDGSKPIVLSLVEKIVGRSEFKGESPVDPFCGMWGSTI